MCGRYGLAVPGRLVELDIADALRGVARSADALHGASANDALLGDVLQAAPRWNITPSQQVHALAGDADGVRPARLQWGLIPSWARDPSIGQRLANARGETVRSKPSFRGAFAARRALVWADLYYEWQVIPGAKRKQPWCFRMRDDAPFALAALWECWSPRPAAESSAPEEEPLDTAAVYSMTLITTEPNALAATVHDRMPVIIAREDYATWLDTRTARDDVEALLKPCNENAMRAYRVSAWVNSPAHDDAQCIAPLEGSVDPELAL
jgi:putative SOS response-associated peptidase YedK